MMWWCDDPPDPEALLLEREREDLAQAIRTFLTDANLSDEDELRILAHVREALDEGNKDYTRLGQTLGCHPSHAGRLVRQLIAQLARRKGMVVRKGTRSADLIEFLLEREAVSFCHRR